MPSMGMPLPRTASLNYEKMYGDFVKCYDFAVHCFIMVALYCREGHTHRGHRRPSPTVFMNNYAKSEFCNAPVFNRQRYSGRTGINVM